MANNDGAKVQYIFALKANINIEAKTITSADGQTVINMEAGMIIASYDAGQTCWLYVAYDPQQNLVVHDITSEVDSRITEIVNEVSSLGGRVTELEASVEGLHTSLSNGNNNFVVSGIAITDGQGV